MGNDSSSHRLAVLTGASAGIGRAIAVRLVQDGVTVIAIGRNEEKLKELSGELGGAHIVPLAGDIADPDCAARALAEAERRGGCDMLINNAGIFPASLLVDAEAAHVENVMRVNFLGVFHFCRAFVPKMLAAGSGSVVNITSVAARTPTPGLSAYAASKAAVEAFSRSIAAEVAPKVRVNCVSPGPTRTESVIEMERTDKTGAVAAVTKAIPLARYGESEEIAETVVFLASERAAFTTGQTYQVNGGMFMA